MIRKAKTALVSALAAIGLLYVVVSTTPLVNWWARRLAGPMDDPRGRTLIVLGGSMLEPGVIGLSSYWRSVYAVRAYQSGGFQRVLVSGGPPDNPVSAAMKQFLECSAVPPGAITAETQSGSTRENALRAAALLRGDPGPDVLLTSDYHMYRARRAFEKAGLRVAPRPFPDAIKRGQSWSGRWPVFLELCVETAKIGYYYARGWI